MKGHFNSSGKQFICVSSDNRVSLFDTDTQKRRRVYVEKNHLSHSYHCSSWRNGKNEDLGLFAVGASDGTVIIWDLVRGVVSKVIGQVNESAVPSDIVFANDGKSLFVCSEGSSQILQYNVSDGSQLKSLKAGKKGASKMAINPKAGVLAVAR